MENGAMFLHSMRIDTVVIEPERRDVSMVWRAVLGKGAPLRKLEIQLFGEAEHEFMRHVAEMASRTNKPPVNLTNSTPNMTEG